MKNEKLKNKLSLIKKEFEIDIIEGEILTSFRGGSSIPCNVKCKPNTSCNVNCGTYSSQKLFL